MVNSWGLYVGVVLFLCDLRTPYLLNYLSKNTVLQLLALNKLTN